MASNGFISDYEDGLRAQDLVVTDRPVGVQRVAAEHFAEEVRRRVYDIYGEKKLYGGGLSIRSTLNTDFQTYAQRACALAYAIMTGATDIGACGKTRNAGSLVGRNCED